MQFSEVPNMSEPNAEFTQQSQGANKQVGYVFYPEFIQQSRGQINR